MKPLRVIGGFKKVKAILKAITESVKSLSNVILLILVYLALYAGLGLNIYNGVLENRCRTTVQPTSNNIWEIDLSVSELCGTKSCPKDLTCGNSLRLGVGFDIKLLDNDDYNYGMTRFDSLMSSLISIFEVFIGEGWTNIMQIVKKFNILIKKKLTLK